MYAVDAVILAGWAVFWLYWFVASFDVKARRTRWTWFAGIRVAIVLLVLLLLRLEIFRRRAAVSNPWMQGIGLALFVLGLALAAWARTFLGRNWGMPMARKPDPQLVTNGPYRTIRHPIYTGFLLALVGTAIAVSLYWLIAVAVVGAYLVYSAVREERYMAERFPDSYPDYKRSTKMLIPFIL